MTALVLVAAALSAVFPGAGHAALVSGTKVMPLGDSITYGYKTSCATAEGGYRTGLYTRLATAGITPDFVGSLSNGPTTLSDKDHEGHCGWRIDQIADNIGTYLTAAQPDVVLLHLGTNDMWQDYSVSTAPARLSALLDDILVARPGVTIYVASLVPATTTAVQARVAAFNQALPGIVNAKVATGADVHYVNMHDALMTSQFVDVLHPDDSGYDSMAQAWYDALMGAKPNLVLGGGFEDQLTNSITSPWGTQTTSVGAGSFGNDRNLPAKNRTGHVNGWIATSGTAWNALTQSVTVRPSTNYRMTVWLRNSGNFTTGWLGVKKPNNAVINEINHGAQTGSYGKYTVDFSSGTQTTVVLHVGYWGLGTSSWEQIDDISIAEL